MRPYLQATPYHLLFIRSLAYHSRRQHSASSYPNTSAVLDPKAEQPPHSPQCKAGFLQRQHKAFSLEAMRDTEMRLPTHYSPRNLTDQRVPLLLRRSAVGLDEARPGASIEPGKIRARRGSRGGEKPTTYRTGYRTSFRWVGAGRELVGVTNS